MAAEVTSLVRVLNRYRDDRTPADPSSALVTRDLLGAAGTHEPRRHHHHHHVGNGSLEYQELDLDMQVPSGWEKRLDLKSGKVYLQRSNTPVASTPSDHHRHHQKQHSHESNQTVTARLQDLNFPPSPPSSSSKSSRSKAKSRGLLNLFDEARLELKLVSSSSSSPQSSGCVINQSVCTLDKVKSALERAKTKNQKKRISSLPLSPSYSSSSSSSIRDHHDQEIDHHHHHHHHHHGNNNNNLLVVAAAAVGDYNDEGEDDASPIAVGCPGCLCYVLILKNDPKCPRCNSRVPLPALKKPRIDLNVSV